MVKHIALVICIGILLRTNAQISVSVNVIPNNPCDTCVNLTAIASGGVNPYTYQWILNASLVGTSPSLVYCNQYPGFSNDSLRLIVTDANSQQASILYYASSFLTSALTDIDFCLATVDSATGKSMLIWEQSTNPATASYVIYKKNTSSFWVVIATIPKTSLSAFIDTSSNPAVTTNWYNLSVADSCGFQTPWSAGIAINTIHLAVSAGLPPAWNLSWNWTQGYPITKYRIWRGTTTSAPILVDSVSNSVFAYTDVSPPANISKYLIEAVSTANCNPSLKHVNAAAFNSSFSNIAVVTVSSVNESDIASSISVYPNPFSDQTTLVTKHELNNATLLVNNYLGESVAQIKNVSGQKIVFSGNNLPRGIYLIRIISGTKIFSGKLIITY